MARALASDLDVKRKDLLSVFPEDLIVNPLNRGREFPPTDADVLALANDISKHGQLQPVSVTITHDKRLELVAGFTRYEAILFINNDPKAAGLSDRIRIECKVIDGNAEEMFLANISENRLRNETSAVDDAFNVRRLGRDFSKTDAEILVIYGGKSQAWLDQLRKLLTLSRKQQQEIHTGQLTASTGYLLADIEPEKREALVEEVKKSGKVTTAKVLKEARKTGKLNKVVSLKLVEVKGAFEYLQQDNNVAVRKLSNAVLEYISGKLPEPDLFSLIHKLLNDKK